MLIPFNYCYAHDYVLTLEAGHCWLLTLVPAVQAQSCDRAEYSLRIAAKLTINNSQTNGRAVFSA